MYINEIIRVTYKCNWKCKFCNVLKTNNYGSSDISEKEIIFKILELTRKYNKSQLKDVILSFSGGEPTLNNNLFKYIKLAKIIGIGTIQVQTNGSIIFSNYNYFEILIKSGLNEVFLANHSENSNLNLKMGSYSNLDNFLNFLLYFKKNKLYKKIRILTNIVVNKINIDNTKKYIDFLIINDYFKIINNNHISIGFVQPNGYANLNKEEVLLIYDDYELSLINEFINFSVKNNLSLDFHFTSPPLCIIDKKEFNLEYKVLNNLENDKKESSVVDSNLDKYKFLWKEKEKLDLCKNCSYNKYCLGFYKNWINFVGEDYVKEKINNFLKD